MSHHTASYRYPRQYEAVTFIFATLFNPLSHKKIEDCNSPINNHYLTKIR